MNPALLCAPQVCLYRLAKGEKVALYIAPGSKRTPDAVVDAITELKAQEPVMAWGIECYHYEMRTVTTWTSDANGNMYPVTSTVGVCAVRTCNCRHRNTAAHKSYSHSESWRSSMELRVHYFFAAVGACWPSSKGTGLGAVEPVGWRCVRGAGTWSLCRRHACMHAADVQHQGCCRQGCRPSAPSRW